MNSKGDRHFGIRCGFACVEYIPIFSLSFNLYVCNIIPIAAQHRHHVPKSTESRLFHLSRLVLPKTSRKRSQVSLCTIIETPIFSLRLYSSITYVPNPQIPFKPHYGGAKRHNQPPPLPHRSHHHSSSSNSLLPLPIDSWLWIA